MTPYDRFPNLRPKMHNGTLLLPAKEGVHLRNDGGAAVIYTDYADELTHMLTNYVVGDMTLAEIRELFQGELVEEITRLILNLYQDGFVTHVVDEARAEVPDAVRAQFKTQIELLNHLSSRPWAAFHDFRKSHPLLVGSGISFRACAGTLLQSGVERLSLLLIGRDEVENNLQEVHDAVDSLRAQGMNAQVSVVKAEQAMLLEEYDVIACCTDLPYLRELYAFERRARQLRRPFYAGIVIANRGFMGPMIKADSVSCWVCTMIRQSYDHLDEELRNSFGKNYVQLNLPFGPEFMSSEIIAGIIGTEVAFELFKAMAGDVRAEMRNCMQVYMATDQGSPRVVIIPYPPTSCIRMCRYFKIRQNEYYIKIDKKGWSHANPVHGS